MVTRGRRGGRGCGEGLLPQFLILLVRSLLGSPIFGQVCVDTAKPEKVDKEGKAFTYF